MGAVTLDTELKNKKLNINVVSKWNFCLRSFLVFLFSKFFYNGSFSIINGKLNYFNHLKTQLCK